MRFDLMRGLSLLAATCAIILACDSDSSTEPSGDLIGSVKFTYSGAGLNGAFDARGGLKNGMPTSSSAAYGIVSEEDGGEAIGIFASALGPDKSYFDSFWALLSEQTTGTYSVGLNCQPSPGTKRCAYIEVEFDTPMEGEDEGAIFTLISGELTVTSVDGKRLKGTFTGTGLDEWGDGTAQVTITNGTFDVPVLDASDIPGLKTLSPGSARPLGKRGL